MPQLAWNLERSAKTGGGTTITLLVHNPFMNANLAVTQAFQRWWQQGASPRPPREHMQKSPLRHAWYIAEITDVNWNVHGYTMLTSHNHALCSMPTGTAHPSSLHMCMLRCIQAGSTSTDVSDSWQPAHAAADIPTVNAHTLPSSSHCKQWMLTFTHEHFNILHTHDSSCSRSSSNSSGGCSHYGTLFHRWKSQWLSYKSCSTAQHPPLYVISYTVTTHWK